MLSAVATICGKIMMIDDCKLGFKNEIKGIEDNQTKTIRKGTRQM